MARLCDYVVMRAACACAALLATVLVTRVQWPLVQAWFTCPSCIHWSTLYARQCVRCLGRQRGAMACVRACGVVCAGVCSSSLRSTGIGDTGAAAIGAALVHLPQLQALK
jgi:hypothetical protein